VDEVIDVWMVDVEDDHLCRATRLATGFDYAGKSIKAFHEAERTRSLAAARELFFRSAQRRKIGSGAAAPLEEHAFSLGESEDGVEAVAHRVDEARRALRSFVSGNREFHGAFFGVPVPVLCVREWLQAVTTNVEPYGRIKRSFLLDQNMNKLIVKCVAVF